MPIEKRNISISFAKGVDTKTDPRQVMPGNLTSLENAVFTEGLQFNSRSGYTRLAATTAGLNLATYNAELAAFDGNNLHSYSPSTMTLINKGNISSVDLAVMPVYRGSTSQTQQDSSFHSSGLYLYVWVDSTQGAQYMVVSSTTGNQVIPSTNLPANAIYPRAWCVGNYLVITYIDNSANRLKYISIAAYSLAVGTPTDISTQVNTSNKYYDGTLLNNNLYLSWNGSDVGGSVRTSYLNQYLTQGNVNATAGEAASNAISIFSDTINNNVWITYYNGSAIRYFILDSSLGSVLTPTAVVSTSNVLNLTGYASAAAGTLYYQTQNTYSYSSTRTDFISSVSLTQSGTVGTAGVFLRSVGLTSKVFTYSGMRYFVVAHQSSLQPTYFVVTQNGTIIAKIAYTNGGGYSAQSALANVNAISATQFQFSYLYKSLLETQQGQVYTQTGVNSAVVDFSATNQALFQNIELGQNLNITGGFLWAYDGYAPVEQNFHLFPEDYLVSASTASTGTLPGNTYSYIPLYEWTDNQGNIHRSGFGTPFTFAFTNATTGITTNVPTLRLTEKQNESRSPVNITLYRTAPSVANGIYYRVTSSTSPVLNSTGIDSVAIIDRAVDSSIIGNPLLYTTGGVVPNTGGPAAIAMTNYKNRLILVPSENRKSFWYSKQVVGGSPVEMSDSFQSPLDPKFGDVDVVSVMDDKLIFFNESAIFYLTGQGPNSTGSDNDFTDPVFITSVTGCSNPKSMVLTQDGLMFQSNKGIWLLDRSLTPSYIGADVEDYNSDTVTSAQLIPGTTQVQFTLSSGTALMYDYYYKQWGTFTNHDAVGAVNFQGAFTYINADGVIFQASAAAVTDAGAPFFKKIQTGWLSFAGFQGFQRVFRLYIKGQFVSPFTWTVSIAYDFNPNPSQTVVIRPQDLVNPDYGDDPYWGSVDTWGGADPSAQYRVNLHRQKCQSIQITIQEGLDTETPTYGALSKIEALGLLIGVKSSYPRLPPTKSVT